MKYLCTTRDGQVDVFDTPDDVRAWVHVQMSEQDLEWWNGIGLTKSGEDPVAGEWFVFDQNGEPGEVGVTVELVADE